MSKVNKPGHKAIASVKVDAPVAKDDRASSKKPLVEPGQTKVVVSASGAVTNTRPTNALASRLAMQCGPVGTPVDSARESMSRLLAKLEALAPRFERRIRDFEIGVRLLDNGGARHEYGKLAEALERLSTASYYAKDEGGFPPDVKHDLESSFLSIFEDYLAATGEALDQFVASAKADPNLRTVSTLEERQRYARSAARGGGKSENEQFGRFADDIAKDHPKQSVPVQAARVALMEKSMRAFETRLDLLGLGSTYGTLEQRVALLTIDAPRQSAKSLGARLDAVQSALDGGDGRFASRLFWEVSDAVPRLSMMKLFAGRDKPLDEATYEKRRKPTDALLSLADAEAITARMEAMRPAVKEASADAAVQMMKRLHDTRLETARNSEYSSSAIVKNPANRKPEHVAIAQRVLVEAFREQFASEHDKLKAAVAELGDATVLSEANHKAAYAAVTTRGAREIPEEIDYLDAAAMESLVADRQAYVDDQAAAETKVEAMYTAGYEAVAQEYAAIDALPPDEQVAATKALGNRTDWLSSVGLYLRREVSGPGRALADAMYDRAYRPKDE